MLLHGPWVGVDQWLCPQQGDKLRKSVKNICNVGWPMQDKDIHPAPPVVEFR